MGNLDQPGHVSGWHKAVLLRETRYGCLLRSNVTWMVWISKQLEINHNLLNKVKFATEMRMNPRSWFAISLLNPQHMLISTHIEIKTVIFKVSAEYMKNKHFICPSIVENYILLHKRYISYIYICIYKQICNPSEKKPQTVMNIFKQLKVSQGLWQCKHKDNFEQDNAGLCFLLIS